MSNEVVALTTIDNPYDPIEEFSDWYSFDTEKGYKTAELLARFAKTSDGLTDSENEIEKERAIDFILSNDYENIYKKIKRVLD